MEALLILPAQWAGSQTRTELLTFYIGIMCFLALSTFVYFSLMFSFVS